MPKSGPVVAVACVGWRVVDEEPAVRCEDAVACRGASGFSRRKRHVSPCVDLSPRGGFVRDGRSCWPCCRAV
jgi:hypothetical protein